MEPQYLWLPYVIETAVILSLLLASFIKFHQRNKAASFKPAKAVRIMGRGAPVAGLRGGWARLEDARSGLQGTSSGGGSALDHRCKFGRKAKQVAPASYGEDTPPDTRVVPRHREDRPTDTQTSPEYGEHTPPDTWVSSRCRGDIPSDTRVYREDRKIDHRVTPRYGADTPPDARVVLRQAYLHTSRPPPPSLNHHDDVTSPARPRCLPPPDDSTLVTSVGDENKASSSSVSTSSENPETRGFDFLPRSDLDASDREEGSGQNVRLARTFREFASQ